MICFGLNHAQKLDQSYMLNVKLMNQILIWLSKKNDQFLEHFDQNLVKISVFNFFQSFFDVKSVKTILISTI